jgi:hypothetical protein
VRRRATRDGARGGQRQDSSDISHSRSPLSALHLTNVEKDAPIRGADLLCGMVSHTMPRSRMAHRYDQVTWVCGARIDGNAGVRDQ